MRVSKGFLALSAAVASLGMATFGPLSASAADPGIDVVGFVQAAAGAHVCWISEECIDGLDVDTSDLSQPYNFGGGTCAGVSIEAGEIVSGPNCTVASNGTFINVVCGTGVVMGNANYSIFPNVTGGNTDSDTAGSIIVPFVATIGVILPGAVGSDPLAGTGVVVLNAVPQVPTGPTSTCTFGFNVTGAFVALS